MKWLRDRATVLLSEGRWFDSPGLQVGVSLGKILNLKLLGKARAKCPKCKYICRCYIELLGHG